MISGACALVTGASGFLGANLVRRLLDAGVQVVAVARPTTDCWRLREVEARIRLIRAELRDLPEAAGPTDVDVVYHLASAGVDQRMHDVAKMVEANVSGTHAALISATRFGARRFVHAGSSGEYGPGRHLDEKSVLAPTSEYGATKAAATLLAHAYGSRTGLPVVTLRPFSVFGPWEAAYRLVPYCTLRALAREPLEMTAGLQTRDFVYVDDVMEAFVAAAEVEAAVGHAINLCTGRSTAVREVASRVVELCGAPASLMRPTRAIEATEMWTTSGSADRALSLLGWQARTPLDDGLRLTAEWFRSHRNEYRV